MSIKSNSGSLLLTAMLAVLGSVAGVALLTVGYHYVKSSNISQKSQAGAGDNVFNLQLVSEKFTIDKTNKKKPLWYPEPYPSEAAILDANTLPTISVIQTGNREGAPFVPLILNLADSKGVNKTFHYELDNSRMGSLLKPEDLKPEEFQTGFVASGDIRSFGSDKIARFLSLPGTGWPKEESEVKDFSNTKTYALSFLKYRADDTSPNLLSSILVKISGESNGIQTSTVANIKVDLPPTPECQVELAPGQTGPFNVGTPVRFIVKTDSITRQIMFSTDGDVTHDTVAVKANQSIRNVWSFEQAGEITQRVPSAPVPGDAYQGAARWRVYATVSGVNPLEAPKKCSLDVATRVALPPGCRLTAAPANIAAGVKTTLSLSCDNEVTTASIAGVPVTYNAKTKLATLTYTKQTNDVEQVSAEVIGPGGKETPLATLGESCPFNNPDYVTKVAMPWTVSGPLGEARELSYAPARSYIFQVQQKLSGRFGWTTVTLNYTYSYSYASGLGFAGSHTGATWDESPCDKNSICMASSACPNGDCNHARGIRWVQYGPATSKDCSITKVRYRFPGQGCFAQGTRILMGDKSEKKIEEIRNGDHVWNPLLKKSETVVDVTAGPEEKALYFLKTAKRELRITEDHPFPTKRGVLMARELKVGDQIILGNQTQEVVRLDKESFVKKETVWNIKTSGSQDNEHILLSNGIPSGDLHLQMKYKLTKDLH